MTTFLFILYMSLEKVLKRLKTLFMLTKILQIIIQILLNLYYNLKKLFKFPELIILSSLLYPYSGRINMA